jgi:hypothetical protein
MFPLGNTNTQLLIIAVANSDLANLLRDREIVDGLPQSLTKPRYDGPLSGPNRRSTPAELTIDGRRRDISTPAPPRTICRR